MSILQQSSDKKYLMVLKLEHVAFRCRCYALFYVGFVPPRGRILSGTVPSGVWNSSFIILMTPIDH